MHHVYGVKTYAAFNASEVLLTARAGELIGYEELPGRLKVAVEQNRKGAIRDALDELDASKELFVFKTHAWATDLFGTNYRAILLVRNGRDALASYANYLVDIRFDSAGVERAFAPHARVKIGAAKRARVDSFGQDPTNDGRKKGRAAPLARLDKN